jgi:hypothetical protein
MTKPSILLIPGSFALPEFYDTIADGVKAKGYEMQALHLPNVGLRTGPRVRATNYVRRCCLHCQRDREARVILIAHSYGGVPMTESSKGLGKEERQRRGKKGGIVNLAYLTALVRAVGTSAAEVPMYVPRDQVLYFQVDVIAPPFHSFISSPLTLQ